MKRMGFVGYGMAAIAHAAPMAKGIAIESAIIFFAMRKAGGGFSEMLD